MAAVDWIQRLAGTAFGGAVERAVPLSGGEVNETYLVTTTTGRRLVCRRAAEEVADWHPTVEGQVAAIGLARDAGAPVPEVVFAEGRILVYRYVDGRPASAGEVGGGLARAAGRVHGLLHRRHGKGVGPVQPDGTSPGWTADSAWREVPRWAARLLEHPVPIGSVRPRSKPPSRSCRHIPRR